jgi:hypothetical protein
MQIGRAASTARFSARESHALSTVMPGLPEPWLLSDRDGNHARNGRFAEGSPAIINLVFTAGV